MSSHCEIPDSEHKRVLWIVLVLNFSMFLLEIWQGLRADSTSLLADAADFASDSGSYIIAMVVLSKSIRTRAKAAMTNGIVMLCVAAFALWQGVEHLRAGVVPMPVTMTWVAMLALAANVTCALLLAKGRNHDANMRAVWLCSRNDAISNIAIIIAAMAVFATRSLWPDLIVALFICALEARGGIQVIRHARQELKS